MERRQELVLSSHLLLSDKKAPSPVDRTLASQQAPINQTIWANAGYEIPPTVGQMIQELRAHNSSLTFFSGVAQERVYSER